MYDENLNFLLNRPIAHRGLWNDEFPENTIPAISNAIKNEYPVEIDVQISGDGIPFLYHDGSFKHKCGIDGHARIKNIGDIKKMTVLGKAGIPTLEEVFLFVDGRVPILIDMKSETFILKNREKCLLKGLIKEYVGPIAIQTFSSKTFGSFYKIFSDILPCGLVLTYPFSIKRSSVDPDFVTPNKKLLGKLSEKFVTLCWTITSDREYTKICRLCDNIIFDSFLPK